MPNKASKLWPDGIEPSIGDSVSGTTLGKNDRGIFCWTSCPQCGYVRWVKHNQVTKTCMSCAARNRKLIGDKNHRWKGGVRQGKDGYRYITVPENHPLIEMAGRVYVHGRYRYYIAEHRLVMAEYLGRSLKSWELVHHKGTIFPITDIRNKSDNLIENLELIPFKHEHLPSMSVERTVAALQSRVVVLEAEVARLQSLLDGSRDNPIMEGQNIGGYNTLGIRKDEGIVQPLSNEDREQNRRSRVCSDRQPRCDGASGEQSPDKLTANSGKPDSSNGYGNPELAGDNYPRASVETLHGLPQEGKEQVQTSRKLFDITSLISLQERIPAALTQWRCENLPKTGNAKHNDVYANPVLADGCHHRASVETLQETLSVRTDTGEDRE